MCVGVSFCHATVKMSPSVCTAARSTAKVALDVPEKSPLSLVCQSTSGCIMYDIVETLSLYPLITTVLYSPLSCSVRDPLTMCLGGIMPYRHVVSLVDVGL